jgi:hypothetical protein
VDRDTVVGPLFAAGDQLGRVGAYALLVAAVAACVALYSRAGTRVLPGGAVLLAAGWSFVDSHIFWPRGVFTMLGFAVGFVLLVWAADEGPAERPGGGRPGGGRRAAVSEIEGVAGPGRSDPRTSAA